MSSSYPAPEPWRRPSETVGRRPGAVAVSHGLWTAAAAVALVASVVLLADLDGVRDAVRTIVDRDLATQPATTRTRAAAVAVPLLVAGPAVVGLAIAVAAAVLRAGRGGARGVLVLLLAVTVGEIVLAVDAVAPAALGLLVLAAALGVAASVLMYLPGAHRWFAVRRR